LLRREEKSPRVPQINHTKIMKEADSEIYSNEQNDPCMYMPVKCGETNIAALRRNKMVDLKNLIVQVVLK
jgi:hypothetical protein